MGYEMKDQITNGTLDEYSTNNMELHPVIHTIGNINHNYIEREATQIITVTVYVKSIEKDTLRVEFKENQLTVLFRSIDSAVVKMHPFLENKNHFIKWELELQGSIEPGKCLYTLKPSTLEIKLWRKSTQTWGSLESIKSRVNANDVKQETWVPLVPKEPITPKVVSEDEPCGMVNTVIADPVEQKVGYTGLTNLGNTCYMNAVLQCLANTTPLRDYFLESTFQREINMDNPLGFRGLLAVNFGVLLRQLWSGKRDYCDPSKLRMLIASKSSQFSGYSQHDAQEFMAFLLDGLHEDLNRVKSKPLTNAVESDGKDDKVVAEEAWKVYKMRNNSVIVDLFQGQYKSTLICPVCNKISVTFDPFLYLSLPLPQLKRCFRVLLFFRDTSRLPVKVTIWLNAKSTVKHLKEELRRVYHLNNSEVSLIVTEDGCIRKELSDHFVLDSYSNSDSILAFEVLASSPNEEVVQIPVIQRILHPAVPSHCSSCRRERSQDSKLFRCTKCFHVAYCDRTCQTNHWDVHKANCRKKPVVVAHPFIISLRKLDLTYKNLYQAMLAYSRFSTEVTQIDNCEDECQSVPQFFIKPVTHLGESIPGAAGDRIEDRGDTLLDLSNQTCLALDWRNNELSKKYCIVRVKPIECVDEVHGKATETNKLTLDHCLEEFMEPEFLSREEAWYCPRCKEHRQATKQMSLWRLPDILIIQLKRFSFKSVLWRDKIDGKVYYPLKGLNLAPFVSQSTSVDNPVYDLFAVTNHYGNMLSGHYTAFAKCPSLLDDDRDELGWRCMDDRCVNDIEENSVVTSSAYLLFYRRRRTKWTTPESTTILNYSNPEEVD